MSRLVPVKPPHAFALLVPLLALVTAAFVPGVATAGVNNAWQTHLKTNDFTDVLVTGDVVWCATAEAGLLRFDRATKAFTPIVREPGAIASNHLTCLTYDSIGRLWVGTAEAGVSRLSADGTTWELVNAFDGLPVDSVTTMTVTGDTLWIGTRKGFALWDGRQVLGSLPDGNTLSFDTTFAVPAMRGIGVLGDTLWLATQRGVGFARISTNLTDWRPANAGLPDLEVDHLVADGRDVLVQCIAGIYRWDAPSATWVPTDPLSVVHVLKQEQGVAFVTSSAGMFRYIGDGHFIQIANAPVGTTSSGDDPEPGAGPGFGIHYAGMQGVLWEETPGAWNTYPILGPPGNVYCNLVLQGGYVYAATRFEGLGRWNGSSWFNWPVFSCVGACPNDFRNLSQVFAMVADRLGRKWVSCWGFAIDRFDDSTNPLSVSHYWTNPADPNYDGRHTLAFGAAAESAGVNAAGSGIWLGMDTSSQGVVQPLGLDYYDSTGAWVATFGPSSSPTSLVRGGKIRAVTVDKTGRIWIGYAGSANSGVDNFLRRPEVGAAFDYRQLQGAGASSMDVWGLVAHDDDIWVLTDRDLKRVNRASNRITTTYPTPAGRPLGMRLMDASPDGSVWVGSEEGVRWYHPNGTFQDFTTANSPLASNDVRAIAVDRATGSVWFGTAEGLNRFDPSYQPPALPPGMPDTLHVYPNPAVVTGVGVSLRLQGTSQAYKGGIYDLNGRLLHSFTTRNRGDIAWDGRDQHGDPVKPGVYFVRAEGGGREARARFVLLR